MSDDIEFELKKPLEKMTIKELRSLAIEKIPQITGASGMEKTDLLCAIRDILGIAAPVETSEQACPSKDQLTSIKAQINELQALKKGLDKKDKMKRISLRRQIHNLKKKSRRLA